MQFHPSQSIIALDKHRFRVLCCGRRFGKTTLAIEEIKGRSAIPNSRTVYIAPTYQQARDICWNQLRKELSQAALKINETRLEITLVNGSAVSLRGWESVDTLRGQQFDLMILDEVASMREFELNWQEVLRPTLTDTRGEALFISTPKGFNHFYDLFNQTDADFKSFHFTTYDNPHIPKDEIDKAAKEMTADRFAQEYLADFRKTEGLVYKEFDRTRHIDTIKTNFIKRFAGVDFGFRHKAVVLTILKDPHGAYYIDEEWVHTGYTDAQVADYVAAQNFNEVYPDPESASGCEEMRRRGINVRDVIKNKDSVKNGIDIVRELFKANLLFISPKCPNLIHELETYAYNEERPNNPRADENPRKENDDCVDAMRYGLMMESPAWRSDGVSVKIVDYSI